MSDTIAEGHDTMGDRTVKRSPMLGNIVFGIGIALLLAGVGYFVRGIYLEGLQPSTQQVSPKTVKKSDTKPYSQYNKQQKPWSQERKPNFPPPPPDPVPATTRRSEVAATKQLPSPKRAPGQQAPLLYTCNVLGAFDRLVGKEIVYFVRRESAGGSRHYEPAFKSKDWNGEGYVLKHQFVALQIDKQHKMIKTQEGRWIPVQQFTSCEPQKVHTK